MNNHPQGTALICDKSGTIIHRLCDELNLLPDIDSKLHIHITDVLQNQNIPGIATEADKGLNESASLNNSAPFRLTTRQQSRITSGLYTESYLIFFITDEQNKLQDFYWALLSDHIHQPEILKILLEARAVLKHNTGDNQLDESLFTQFSRLNNELNTAQRNLQKKNTELEQLIHFKNEMMGMAAHDLRNPLSTIMSLSDLLLNEQNDIGPLNDDQANFLDKIFNSSKYMLKLVEGMLEISHIESGNVKLEFEKFDLISFIQRIVSLNRHLADKNSVELDTHAKEGQVFIEADSSKLEQVLNNLIINAIKFTHPKTTVAVTVSYDPEHHSAIVSVADEGPGISSEDQEEVFKPFNKVSKNKNAGKKGTGLGLAISERIIKAHKGTISVQSNPGEGATFTFTLPVDATNSPD